MSGGNGAAESPGATFVTHAGKICCATSGDAHRKAFDFVWLCYGYVIEDGRFSP